jgi:hypothetical protein
LGVERFLAALGAEDLVEGKLLDLPAGDLEVDCVRKEGGRDGGREAGKEEVM